MKQSTAGFGTPIIIAIVAVVAFGGGFLYVNQSGKTEMKDTMEENSPEIAVNETVSHETDTMMKDDQRLEELTAEELAADGPQTDEFNPDVLPTDQNETPSDLDGYLLVGDEQDIDGAYLPQAPAGEFTNHTGDFSYAEEGDLVLFFHADWCPGCRALEKDINANLSQIPDGLSIQKVNYDTETELRKKYGVVRQHTLVQVDENGNEIKTLTGLTNTLNQVVNQI